MTWLTFLIAGALAFTTYRAWRNGFVRELVSLSAVILAVPVAGVFYDDMYPKVHPIVDDDSLAKLISFLAILFGVIVAGQVLAHLLRQVVSLLNLGVADRFAGAAFGLLKGIVLCQVVLIALVVFPSPDLRNSIDDSPLATRLLDSAPVVLAVLPAAFDEGLDAFLDGVNTLTTASETPGAGSASGQ